MIQFYVLSNDTSWILHSTDMYTVLLIMEICFNYFDSVLHKYLDAALTEKSVDWFLEASIRGSTSDGGIVVMKFASEYCIQH